MDKATHMEARLMGLSKKRRKDGDWFELVVQVHPDQMPNELYAVPLGTRIGVAMVQIADDETEKPAKEKRKFEDLPPSQQAGIRCNDPAFQNWCMNNLGEDGYSFTGNELPSDLAALHVRVVCGVDSRSQLSNPIAAANWHSMNAQFEADTRLPEQR